MYLEREREPSFRLSQSISGQILSVSYDCHSHTICLTVRSHLNHLAEFIFTRGEKVKTASIRKGKGEKKRVRKIEKERKKREKERIIVHFQNVVN